MVTRQDKTKSNWVRRPRGKVKARILTWEESLHLEWQKNTVEGKKFKSKKITKLYSFDTRLVPLGNTLHTTPCTGPPIVPDIELPTTPSTEHPTTPGTEHLTNHGIELATTWYWASHKTCYNTLYWSSHNPWKQTCHNPWSWARYNPVNCKYHNSWSGTFHNIWYCTHHTADTADINRLDFQAKRTLEKDSENKSREAVKAAIFLLLLFVISSIYPFKGCTQLETNYDSSQGHNCVGNVMSFELGKKFCKTFLHVCIEDKIWLQIILIRNGNFQMNSNLICFFPSQHHDDLPSSLQQTLATITQCNVCVIHIMCFDCVTTAAV